MSVEKFWMVVDWNGHIEFLNELKFPPSKAPKYIHQNKESAESECLRLAEAHPSGEFVVLEAMSFARSISNEWATLTTKSPVIKAIRLEDCVLEDDIP